MDGVSVEDLVAQSAVSSPTVLVQPKDCHISEGGTAIMRVTAGGSGPLGFQWGKDGNSLTDNGNVSGATTAQLTITGVKESDAGTYSVIVTNEAGLIKSREATMTVMQDLVTPTLVITSPRSGSRSTNGLVSIRGTAKEILVSTRSFIRSTPQPGMQRSGLPPGRLTSS